jgi:hypothetical protein
MHESDGKASGETGGLVRVREPGAQQYGARK